MQVMGLYTSAYWLSWVLYAAFMLTISTVVMQACWVYEKQPPG